MSLILHYKFDQSDITLDSSGNSYTLSTSTSLTGTVVSNNDTTYGNVAYFDGNSGLRLASPPAALIGDIPRTISMWVKRNSISDFMYLHANGGTGNDYRQLIQLFNNDSILSIAGSNRNGASLSVTTSPPAFTVGTWFHIVFTYEPGTFRIYVNGTLGNTGPDIMEPNSQALTLGFRDNATPRALDGYMSDYRVYDYKLSDTEVAQLFSNGPNDFNVPSLEVIAYTHIVDLTWPIIDGASSYTINYIKDSGVETLFGNTSETSFTSFYLTQNSVYEFLVYSNLDVINHYYTKTVTIPIVNSTNVGLLLTRINNDLTILNDVAQDEIEPFLGVVLSNGESIITKLGKGYIVINNGTLNIPDTIKTNILTSFDSGSGPGQSFSILLTDLTTTVVSYDETVNEITIEGSTYSTGDVFILDGKKVTVVEI